MDVLRIGEIPYLDCIPYFHYLKKNYSQDFYQFVSGHPSELNSALKRGEIDISISSSIEYAQYYDTYLVFPELCIGSTGAVGSVLLFSDLQIDDLDEMPISIPSASASGVSLLKVLLGKYYQFTNQFKSSWADTEAHLLIGDSALREKTLNRYQYIYDLGELWRSLTGLPMVFALWLVKRETARKKREQLLILHRSLKYAIEESRKNWEALYQEIAERYNWMKKEVVINYWKGIDFSLTSQHIRGLLKFFEDAEEMNLIDEAPEEIEFVETPI